MLLKDDCDLELLGNFLVDVCTALEGTVGVGVCIALEVASEGRFMPCISSKVS